MSSDSLTEVGQCEGHQSQVPDVGQGHQSQVTNVGEGQCRRFVRTEIINISEILSNAYIYIGNVYGQDLEYNI